MNSYQATQFRIWATSVLKACTVATRPVRAKRYKQ